MEMTLWMKAMRMYDGTSTVIDYTYISFKAHEHIFVQFGVH